MKKNFMTRALTVALSAAMALSLSVVGNVTDASAAAAPKFSSTSKTLKAGAKSVVFKATAATKKTYKISKAVVKAGSDDVITLAVNKSEGFVRAKRKGDNAGSATISVKFVNAKTKTAYKKVIKLAVNVEANETFSVAETELNLVKGEEKALTVTGKDVTFKSSDEKIATVDSTGKVTAVAAGKADINVTCGDKTAKVAVTVKTARLVAAKQTKTNEFEATFEGATKDITVNQLSFATKVTGTETSIIYPINNFKVDAKDATKVTFNTFSELKDGKTYTLTYDGTTIDIVVTDGKVASVVVDPIVVTVAEETEIKAFAKDANGVQIQQVAVTLHDASNGAAINGAKVTLAKIGDTVKADAKWSSGKYDPKTGKPEGDVEVKDVVVTAVANAEETKFAMRISKDLGVTAYSAMKDGNQARGAQTSYNIAFDIKRENGKDVADTSKYTIETSDKDIFTVTKLVDKKATLDAWKKGTAYVILKNDGVVVSAFQVDVVDAPEIATISLDKNEVTITKTNSTTLAALGVTEVTYKVKDQYGDDIAATGFDKALLSVDGVTAANASANPAGITLSIDPKKITLDASVNKGTYVYKIFYKKNNVEVCAQTLTIKVVPQNTDSTTITHAIVLDKNKIDTTVTQGIVEATLDQYVTISMVEYQGGTPIALTGASFAITGPNGKVITASAIGTNDVYGLTAENSASAVIDKSSFDATATTFAAVQVKIPVRKNNANAISKLPAGQYKVAAKCGGKDYVEYFTVEDNQTTAIPASFGYTSSETITGLVAPTTADAIAAVAGKIYVTANDYYTANHVDKPANYSKTSITAVTLDGQADGLPATTNAKVRVTWTSSAYTVSVYSFAANIIVKTKENTEITVPYTFTPGGKTFTINR